jgi:hypothetical protein
MNLYEYVKSNPITGLDYSGEKDEDCCKKPNAKDPPTSDPKKNSYNGVGDTEQAAKEGAVRGAAGTLCDSWKNACSEVKCTDESQTCQVKPIPDRGDFDYKPERSTGTLR